MGSAAHTKNTRERAALRAPKCHQPDFYDAPHVQQQQHPGVDRFDHSDLHERNPETLENGANGDSPRDTSRPCHTTTRPGGPPGALPSASTKQTRPHCEPSRGPQRTPAASGAPPSAGWCASLAASTMLSMFLRTRGRRFSAGRTHPPSRSAGCVPFGRTASPASLKPSGAGVPSSNALVSMHMVRAPILPAWHTGGRRNLGPYVDLCGKPPRRRTRSAPRARGSPAASPTAKPRQAAHLSGPPRPGRPAANGSWWHLPCRRRRVRSRGGHHKCCQQLAPRTTEVVEAVPPLAARHLPGCQEICARWRHLQVLILDHPPT